MTHYPHAMQLAGPWQMELLTEEGSPRSTRRVTLPTTWAALESDRAGHSRWSRRFRCPSNLDPEERVWLCLTGWQPGGRVALDGRRLGALGTGMPRGEFDVTPGLSGSHRLEIEIDPPAAGDCATQVGHHADEGVGSAWLEVRSRQFLRHVSLFAAQQGARLQALVCGVPTAGELTLTLSHAQREVWHRAVRVGEWIDASIAEAVATLDSHNAPEDAPWRLTLADIQQARWQAEITRSPCDAIHGA